MDGGHNMGKWIKNEKGLAVVEATLLLPFCFIMIIALYYVAIFMCQRANLQANVQNALIYYKNTDSDNFVTASPDMAYEKAEGTISAVGSSYQAPEDDYSKSFPYRFLSFRFSEDDFQSFFRSMVGYMFFDNGENVQISADSKNYIVYKTITATATQNVKPAISLKMVGGSDTITISATATAVVTNSDDFIRNTDFVVDVVSKTKLGQKASELIDKAWDFYGKFKERFNIS